MADDVIDIDQAIALAGAESIFEEIECERPPEEAGETDELGEERKTNVELLEECLMLNQVQLEHLHDLERDIRQTLAAIAQYRLKKERGDKECNTIQSFRPAVLSFSSPYFKVPNGPSPYPNKDTLAKKRNKFEFGSEIPFKNPMTKEDHVKLEIAVSEELSRTSRSRKMEPNSVVRTITDEDFNAIDWKHITHMSFDDAYSPQTCRLVWKNFLSPNVNRNRWTAQEDSLIKELAIKELNWDNIAIAVGNNRTPFLCFSRYARELSKSLFTARWSKVEDALLVQVVERCKINAHIPWSKVAYFMPARTRNQCQQRFSYSLKKEIHRGRFKREEEFNLVLGVEVFGKVWRKLKHFFPNRVSSQLYSKYDHFFNATFSPWTPEEDQKLLNLVRINGAKSWVQVAQSMDSSKNRKQCRLRYLAMCRQKELFPEWTIADNSYYTYETCQFKKQQGIFTDLLSRIKKRFNITSFNEDTTPLTVGKIHEFLVSANIPKSDLILFMRENFARLSTKQLEENPKGGRDSLFPMAVHAKAGDIEPDKILPYSPQMLLPRRKISKVKKLKYADRRLSELFMSTYKSPVLQTRGEILAPQSEEEVKPFAEALAFYSSVLNHENLNFQNSGLNVDIANSLEKAFQANLSETKKSKSSITSAAVPSQPIQRVVKTYGKRSKVQHYTEAPAIPSTADRSDAKSQLLPPNLSSLIAMRCMLLDLHNLRVIEDSSCFDTKIDKIVTDKKSKSADEPVPDHERPKGIKQADDKLFHVIKTIFALPGIMTLHKPPTRSDLFLGSNLCAKNPLPAEEIAMTVKSTGPNVRRKYKRRTRRPENLPLPSFEMINEDSKRIKLE